ncbi:MAG TPA: PP2C family protein-serine/threonine phosphatase [Nocardioidaceae bacterium]|nr:PP2C family protein-serine/threonine phosphatase [Nocardioidaceae bacterium]
MKSERAPQLLGASLAIVWLVALVVVDVVVPGAHLVLAAMFSLSPLIACAMLPPASTAVIAAVSIGLAVASGIWDGSWGSGQQTIRILDVALISTAAVIISAVRVRREQRQARLSAIAEVAQRAILPKLPSRTAHLSVAVRYVSAAQDAVVGGDLYDCFLSDAHTRFLIGDVRGKGIAGVEQAARVIRAFRQSAATEPALPDVAREMSAYLRGFFDDEEFVTAVLVEESTASTLTLVSCGHPPPLLVRCDGSASFVELPAGLPLGLGEAYEAGTASLRPGDRVLLYTDGVSEARDRQGVFLPVLDLAPLVAAGTVHGALDEVLDAVRRHVTDGRLTDDLAVLLLERTMVEQRPPSQSLEGEVTGRSVSADESSLSPS